jgi:ADP-ribosylglycohydrolase
MNINRDEYVSKVLGCWMGKNAGGTLGAPFEWKRQVNDVTFYTQDLGGEPAPNDDLDLQLLWLIALEEQSIELDAATLAEYWLLYITPHWSEYGVAKANMRAGLMPPLCGIANNIQKDSCGSFIRSEIWACIAPGFPALAARYAYNDAIVDHGDGEGVYGEMFCAAMESAAFVENDLQELLRIGLSYIPAGCGVAQAVRHVIQTHQTGQTWLETRDSLLGNFRGSCKFGAISQSDAQKGFDSGRPGWDAPGNVAIAVLGLLYGGEDFEKVMAITVNCGEDTDCTAATAGAMWGLLHGIAAIPERWARPIGRRIKAAFLNLGELAYQVPADIDELTGRTERIMRQVLLRNKLPLEVTDRPTDLSGLQAQALLAGPETAALLENIGCPVFRFPFYEIAVDYGDEPVIRSGEAKTIRLRILNTYKVQANLAVRCYAPAGWRVRPAQPAFVYIPHRWRTAHPVVIELTLETDCVSEPLNRFAVELTSPGRTLTMLVPIMLANGDLTAHTEPPAAH